MGGRVQSEKKHRRARDKLTKSLGERKNSINVWNKLYKLFQHNGVDVDIEDFPLPKPKKLKEYEKIMEKVWDTVGWEWIKSLINNLKDY